jgi:hypothetical protein
MTNTPAAIPNLLNDSIFNDIDPRSLIGNISMKAFTFIHELSGTKNEFIPSATDNVRGFRDITTDVFTNTFLSDDKTRYHFISYTYHMINTYTNKQLSYLEWTKTSLRS